MWQPIDRNSYEAARSEDGASSSSASEGTLQGEDDMPLTREEIAFADPFDDKHRLRVDTRPLDSPRSIAFFKDRLRKWAGRSPTSPTAETAVATPNEDAAAGLLGHKEVESSAEEGGLEQPRWHPTTQQTVSWLIWPLPSFTHRFFVNTTAKSEVHRPTDYLDGMRGVASLFVFFCHYLSSFASDFTRHAFGEGKNHWYFFELPILRVIYSGAAMVAVFFVISGYVLSARCVVAMRTNKHDKLYNALASMSFRRAIRLFLPSVILTFLVLVITILGGLESPNPNATVFSELHRYWMYLMEDLFKLWTWEASVKGWFANQLWTIPLEFKCSMVLFLFILMVARCKIWVRFAIEAMMTLYLFYRDRWDIALFIAGMVLAEINIISDERKKVRDDARNNLDLAPTELEPRRRWWQRLLRQLPLWVIFFTAVYLMGYPPEDAQGSPGYDFLASMWSNDWDYKKRFWLAISAIMLTTSTSYLPGAQAFFTTGVARYLGKISYALYLVHGLMNRLVQPLLWQLFWGVLEKESEQGQDAQFDGGWFLGTFIYVPLVIWAADVFWRAVDIPTVDFAKWVEKKCFKGDKQN